MNQRTAEELCAKVGEVIHMPEDSYMSGQGFMRVRVRVAITQPLCRGRVVTLENGEQSWVIFEYERLPNLCYWCRCLDHADKDCEVWIQSNGLSKRRTKGMILVLEPYLSFPRKKNILSVCLGILNLRNRRSKRGLVFRRSLIGEGSWRIHASFRKIQRRKERLLRPKLMQI